MATHTYLGNFPKDHSSNWTSGLQGVTHSRDHWFFTQEKRILKFHVTTDLRRGSRHAAATISMPAELRNLQCNHFGDPDYFEWKGVGYLFVPVEGDKGKCGAQPRLAVFRDGARLTYVGSRVLPKQQKTLGTGRAGWCAIHPSSRLLHSSHNVIKRGFPVFRYEVDFDALRRRRVELKPKTDLVLTRRVGRGSAARKQVMSVGKYIQGGAFSPEGRLYIMSGMAKERNRDNGIFVFGKQGQLIARSSVNRKPFKFEFHSGLPKFEEPEGLTYWDLDRLRRRVKIPHIEGQLHAILLDSVSVGNDEIFFKHYRVK